ncbi:MAG: FAD/NAD(P)-binding oxidoreductase [Gaiellaceae bacterium]
MPFRVVIAGAGVGALEAALALRALAPDTVSVELIAPEEEFTYRPLAVAEPFHVGEVRRFPLGPLVEAAGAKLRRGTVMSVDPAEKLVRLEDRRLVDYDAFVLALGARPREAVAGSLTFRGPQDGGLLSALLERALGGDVRRIVFAVPAANTWPLPLYELALLMAGYLMDHGTRGVEVLLVTPEERPLGVFGVEASQALRELLEIRGVELQTGSAPIAWRDGFLELAGREPIEADAVVALPQLVGPALAGLPHDGNGFVPTDAHGRVTGTTDVYAAGDSTQFPLKQGGIAAQQADGVAAAIAAELAGEAEPAATRPVVRGLLLTGFVPRYLRSDMSTGRSLIDTEPLWWPPAKIVGRHLAPFLAEHLGLAPILSEPGRAAAVEIEVDPHNGGAHLPV